MAVTTEKKHWWLTNRRIVEKYIKDARSLIATQEESEIISALSLLDAALALSPRLEQALELRARCLLFLRRFKDVADMLQDYIPSLRISDEDSSSSDSGFSSQSLSREGVKLLSSSSFSSSSDSSSCSFSPSPGRDQSFTCFSVSHLKKKLMAAICKSCEKEGHWRYLVLGKACYHLGLMEDAMILLQTGKRLATAAFRRESICWSDDSFSLSLSTAAAAPPSTPLTESESITQLLSHIKLLLRRRAAALAALDAGVHTEAIRHFSKIIESRRGVTPQGFLSQCYAHRASAQRHAWRIADAIADCNRALALEATSIEALHTRASVLEMIKCLPDSLHDLEHLKLLYNSILRDRKLPGPAWKHHNVRYVEIPGRLCTLSTKIKELKQRVANGETGNNVDYYALIGLRRGCSRSELQRAHLLLCLKHKHEKALSFIDRCELADKRDIENVKEKAKMSATLLYRLIQKGYAEIMANITKEEALKEQRKRTLHNDNSNEDSNESVLFCSSASTTNPSLLQGMFCRDLSMVGNLLSQAGFNPSIPMKYEALSC
ncbi:hypothetical protein HN51_027662 [Arachis hypogaea]|uniref:J domain-containing protein n=1 Tax=Arachis hypogaea TaxID=3818 RepID=A0A445BM16_ARAHY|nr:uncharacterized protein LOC112710529 [Arachis hypogaea]QHO34077.1 uncharacterized protein DS421_9g263830 [Arachis hypogaea]RYR39712.1 hypothetical protein Ahy_A09g045297 [Arachis hypogaea]